MAQYSQFSDSNPSRMTGKTRLTLRKSLLLSLALLAALAVAECSGEESTTGSASGTPTAAAATPSKLTVGDKNAFSAPMVAFVELQPKITDQLAAAQASGDWATAEANINVSISQAKEQITLMQTQLSKMPASAQSVANGIVTTADSWVSAASAAVAAGKSGNAESLQASLATIATLTAGSCFLGSVEQAGVNLSLFPAKTSAILANTCNSTANER